MENSARHLVGSVDKALDVLLCFSPEQPELGVSDIARRLDLGVSTVHRLLATLAHKGFVRQNPATAKYALGLAPLQLVATISASSDIRRLTMPQMARLRDLTGETARLHVLVGFTRVCLDQVESNEVVRATGGIGKAYPLYSGAASKAILAYLPPHDVDAVLAQLPAAERPTDTVRQRAETLRAELAHIRLVGFATSVHENAPGAASIAAPLRNYSGRAIAALTVSGPSNRWDTSKMLAFAPALVGAAQQVSSELGFVPGPDAVAAAATV